ncbi:MAG TPA: right-handed parallel beta-helix repeat-containing protein [Vicinamibacteria bacterium]|nr:right-handed parallel beta-helix repeat-containing protein [Vicinamibacteria bacterium]
MRTMTRLVALTFVLLAPSAMARAEVVNCTNIATLPFTVTSPGIYCFNASLAFPAASGIAINIASDDVVLDLNGHVLDGSAAGPTTTTYGILALDRTNVTVRNGTVRGFYIGVQLGGRSPQNNIAEDMRVDLSTTYGLVVRGQGSIARRNLVTRTGGATKLAIGLYGLGDGVHVVDNEVVGTLEGTDGEAMGIRIDSGTGAVVERNVVSNATYGPGSSYGIRLSQSSPQVTIATNRIVNFRNGIFFTFGGSGLYRDNTVGGALVPFTGGTAGSANNTF